MTAESPAPVAQGPGPVGLASLGVAPGSVPLGQVRIYLGSAHRFIWPVHLAGWLELGWTTEPRVTPVPTPGATRTPSKARRSNKEKTLIEVNPTEPNPISEIPIEANPTNEIPVGANPIGANPSGVGSATAVEPLPVLVTDFLVDPSVPTDA